MDTHIQKSLKSIIKKEKNRIDKLCKKNSINPKIFTKLISTKFKKNLQNFIKLLLNNTNLNKLFKKIYSDKKLKQRETDYTVFLLFFNIIKKNVAIQTK